MRNCKKISLNELPKHSSWPKTLISGDGFKVRPKTEKEVIREFQNEKWNDLLSLVKKSDPKTIADVEGLHINLDMPCTLYKEGEFFLTDYKTALLSHIELYSNVLRPYLERASAIVELGAGYGSKLFALSEVAGFSNIPMVGLEFTQNGRDLISLLSNKLNKPVQTGSCDFRSLTIDTEFIPENSLIFTSYSTHYVPEIADDFVKYLLELKPLAVVHFEPFYEHFDENSLHDLMVRKYIELNDYTKNFDSVLKRGAEAKQAAFIKITPKVIGMNPFLPVSVVEWCSYNSKIFR